MPTDITLQANGSPGSPARSVPAVKSAGTAGVDAVVQAETTAVTPSVVDQEQLKDAMSQISSYVQNVQRNLNFSIDDSSGHTVVKVIDAESEEVIRQIPSEEMLALARRLSEMSGEQASGLLMQFKA